MNAQKLFRLDQSSARFMPLDDELVNRHASQLGTGISSIELAGSDKPDALIVTSNRGERFYVYWLTQQILPLARFMRTSGCGLCQLYRDAAKLCLCDAGRG